MNGAEQTLDGRLPVTRQMAAVRQLAAPFTSFAMGEDGSWTADAIWAQVLPAIAADAAHPPADPSPVASSP